MDRKLAINLLARTMWSMYGTVESAVQFCLQKPNVHNSKLLKNTDEVSLIETAKYRLNRNPGPNHSKLTIKGLLGKFRVRIRHKFQMVSHLTCIVFIKSFYYRIKIGV